MWGSGGTWGIFVPPSQFCCKTKTALKRSKSKKIKKAWRQKKQADAYRIAISSIWLKPSMR